MAYGIVIEQPGDMADRRPELAGVIAAPFANVEQAVAYAVREGWADNVADAKRELLVEIVEPDGLVGVGLDEVGPDVLGGILRDRYDETDPARSDAK